MIDVVDVVDDGDDRETEPVEQETVTLDAGCPTCGLSFVMEMPGARRRALYRAGKVLCPAGCGEIKVERPKPSPLMAAIQTGLAFGLASYVGQMLPRFPFKEQSA